MSREKQIEEIRKDVFAAFGGYAKWEEDWQSLAEAIYNAGYRKIIRCKDCEYYEIHKPIVTLNCEREGKLIPMMPDDFCSYAKMKGGAG